MATFYVFFTEENHESERRSQVDCYVVSNTHRYALDRVVCIVGLDDKAQDQFAKRYFSQSDVSEALFKKFTEIRAKQPELAALLNNPTILELICLVILNDGFEMLDNGQYAGQLVPLYIYALDQLLEHWLHEYDLAERNERVSLVKQWLEDVAYRSWWQERKAIISPQHIRQSLTAVAVVPTGETFLDRFKTLDICFDHAFVSDIGVLLPLTQAEHAENQSYMFSHLSLHELLAARLLANQIVSEYSDRHTLEAAVELGKKYYEFPESNVLAFVVGSLLRQESQYARLLAKRILQYSCPPSLYGFIDTDGLKEHFKYWSRAFAEIPSDQFVSFLEETFIELRDDESVISWLNEHLMTTERDKQAGGCKVVVSARPCRGCPGVDEMKLYPLFCATRFGDFGLMVRYFNSDLPRLSSNVELSAAHRQSLLMYAVRADSNRVRMVKFLLEQGADVMYQDNERGTVLHYLVLEITAESREERDSFAENEEIIRLLHGNNPEVINETADRLPPLYYARDPRYFQLLLDLGADVNAEVGAACGEAPLAYFAIEKMQDDRELEENKVFIELLLESGVDPALEHNEVSLLDLAKKKKQKQIVALLEKAIQEKRATPSVL